MRIGKLEAARRQLESASELYFADGDIVAIHTLAAAAHEILRNLNERRMALVEERPIPPFYNLTVKDIPAALAAIGIGRAESPKLIADACNEAENFLKHADRDWNATLELRPKWTELLLFDACRVYAFLTGEANHTLAAYFFWCQLQYPAELQLPGQPADVVEAAREVARQALQVLSKSDFYECYRKAPPTLTAQAPAPGMDQLTRQ